MSLRRKMDRILPTMLGIKFLMTDGTIEVACRVDQLALRFRFGSNDTDGDVAAFQRHREEIESAASQKYDSGKIEDSTDAQVVITMSDLASPLSKKMGGYE